MAISDFDFPLTRAFHLANNSPVYGLGRLLSLHELTSPSLSSSSLLMIRPQSQVAHEVARGYEKSMKSNTAGKSSVTLSAAEHAQVLRLRRLLKLRSNTDVIRRSLKLLEEAVTREELRRQFREASARVRSSTLEEMRELDDLAGEGLEGV